MSADTTPPPGPRESPRDLVDRLRTYGQSVTAVAENLRELLDLDDDTSDPGPTVAHTLLRKLLQAPEVYYRHGPRALTIDGHITNLTEEEDALARRLTEAGAGDVS